MTRFIITYETINFIPPISFKIQYIKQLNKLIFNFIKPFEPVTIIQNINMNTIIFLSISPDSVFFVPDNPR